MSSPGQREMVFCHQCQDEWYRDEHGLTCPNCASEFVEVIEANNNPHAFHEAYTNDDDHQTGWGLPGSVNGRHRYMRREVYTPNGAFVMTTGTYSFSTGGGSNRGGPPDAQAEIFQNFGAMMQGLLRNVANRQGGLNGPRLNPRDANTPQPPHQVVDPLPSIMAQFFPMAHNTAPAGGNDPHGNEAPNNPLFNLMRMVLSGNPGTINGHADAAYSEAEFDRIMSSLLEQAQGGGGAPPASQSDIASIPKKKVSEDMICDHKECTICMDEPPIGDEVSELWCQHWFHTECIKAWLESHGTCPLCRKTLQESREEAESRRKNSKGERRRSHSHRESVAGGGSSSGDANNGGGGIRERLSSLWRGSRQ